MENMGQLLDGLAALAWPLIVLFLLLRFARPLQDIVRSAGKRKFSIKVGDNKLTMEEASEQQRLMINDLQEQVVALQKTLVAERSLTDSVQKLQKSLTEKSQVRYIRRILWVDDYPNNNANIIAHLSDLGIEVVTALSTEEGLREFHSGHYDAIISDMGRREKGEEHPSAGVELASAIRKLDREVPFFIFCSRQGKERAEQDAINAGANGVTTSGVQLLNMLSRSGKVGKL